MNFIDSLSVGMFIFVIVFLVLALLLFIVKLFSYAITKLDSKKSDEANKLKEELPNTTVSKEEDFSSGTLKLINVDEPTAAMIMAIVSHESGIPLSELCFKSIRLINE